MKSAKLSACEAKKFPDIEAMNFYQTEQQRFYFDASYYMQSQQPEKTLSVGEFLEKLAPAIQILTFHNNVAKDDLCVQDKNGSLFLEESLALLFMIYVEPAYLAYMIARMEELFMYGFTINDAMLTFLYQERFERKNF